MLVTILPSCKSAADGWCLPGCTAGGCPAVCSALAVVLGRHQRLHLVRRTAVGSMAAPPAKAPRWRWSPEWCTCPVEQLHSLPHHAPACKEGVLTGGCAGLRRSRSAGVTCCACGCRRQWTARCRPATRSCMPVWLSATAAASSAPATRPRSRWTPSEAGAWTAPRPRSLHAARLSSAPASHAPAQAPGGGHAPGAGWGLFVEQVSVMLALRPLVLALEACAEQRGHAGPAALFVVFSFCVQICSLPLQTVAGRALL